MGQKIILRPLTQIDILEIIKQALIETFNCRVEIEALTLNLDYAYNEKRRQYLFQKLSHLDESFQPIYP